MAKLVIVFSIALIPDDIYLQKIYFQALFALTFFLNLCLFLVVLMWVLLLFQYLVNIDLLKFTSPPHGSEACA